MRASWGRGGSEAPTKTSLSAGRAKKTQRLGLVARPEHPRVTNKCRCLGATIDRLSMAGPLWGASASALRAARPPPPRRPPRKPHAPAAMPTRSFWDNVISGLSASNPPLAPPSRLVRFRRVPETARGAGPRNARFGAPLPPGETPRARARGAPASPERAVPAPPIARGDPSRRDLTPTPRPPPPRALLRSSSHHHHLSARPSHVIRFGPNSFIHSSLPFISALGIGSRRV